MLSRGRNRYEGKTSSTSFYMSLPFSFFFLSSFLSLFLLILATARSYIDETGLRAWSEREDGKSGRYPRSAEGYRQSAGTGTASVGGRDGCLLSQFKRCWYVIVQKSKRKKKKWCKLLIIYLFFFFYFYIYLLSPAHLLCTVAHLGSDLDGGLLVDDKSTLFTGGFVWNGDGTITLSDAPGVGVTKK